MDKGPQIFHVQCRESGLKKKQKQWDAFEGFFPVGNVALQETTFSDGSQGSSFLAPASNDVGAGGVSLEIVNPFILWGIREWIWGGGNFSPCFMVSW